MPALAAVLAATWLVVPGPALGEDGTHDQGTAGPTSPVLRVGAHGDFAPYEFPDENGKATGFSIELLDAVATAAGLQTEVRLGPWKEIRADFEAGRLDLVVGMHITPERRQRYLFTNPYTDLPYDVFVRSDPSHVTSLADLRGRQVLVQAGAMGESLARRAGAVPVAVVSPRDVVRDLSAGRCEYGIVARNPGLWMAAEMGLDHVIPVGLDIPSQGYAFVAMPGNEKLIESLNAGLAAVKESGRYQEIWNRWLGPFQRPRSDIWVWLRYSAWVIGPLAAALLLWGLWTRSLRRQVALRTRQLAAERGQLAVTLRSIADAVVTVNASGEVALANRAAEELLGRRTSEFLGRPVEEVLSAAGDPAGNVTGLVTRCLAGEPVASLVRPARVVRPDGAERLVSGSAAAIRDPDGSVHGAVLVLSDVTERRRMEEELIRAEKLESLGVLAGGIAHDFNNVLAAIVGNLSVARSTAAEGTVAEHLLRAEAAARRASELTRQLLTFSRGGAPVKRLARIDGLVHDAATFILSGSTSRADVRVAEGLWPAEVDTGQLAQVVHNLAVNAAQAMPAGGVVEVDASNATIEEGDPTGLAPGAYVRIRVRDHGTGIPREGLARVFEPFYTTKPGGTGLGLSICYSIVTRHGGWIGAESEPSSGTTFTVLLPASPGASVESRSPQGIVPRPGACRVLVMDDNEMVRATLLAQLEVLGCKAVGTADGAAAVEAFEAARRAGDPFAVVILDLTVPGAMGGAETLARLREIDPCVAAVLATGYSGEADVARFEQSGFAAVLGKPFTLDDLAEAIEKARMHEGAVAPARAGEPAPA